MEINLVATESSGQVNSRECLFGLQSLSYLFSRLKLSVQIAALRQMSVNIQLYCLAFLLPHVLSFTLPFWSLIQLIRGYPPVILPIGLSCSLLNICCLILVLTLDSAMPCLSICYLFSAGLSVLDFCLAVYVHPGAFK